jgi:hypothetical protein
LMTRVKSAASYLGPRYRNDSVATEILETACLFAMT